MVTAPVYLIERKATLCSTPNSPKDFLPLGRAQAGPVSIHSGAFLPSVGVNR